VKVALGKFAQEGIEAQTGGDLESGTEVAVQRYAERLGSDEAPVSLPGFLDRAPADEVVRTLDLQLGPEVRAALELEADRQLVPLGDLVSHAVLSYLAELDSISAISCG